MSSLPIPAWACFFRRFSGDFAKNATLYHPCTAHMFMLLVWLKVVAIGHLFRLTMPASPHPHRIDPTGLATIIINWMVVRAQYGVCLPAPALVSSVACTTSLQISRRVPLSCLFSTNLKAITPVIASSSPYRTSTKGPLPNLGFALRNETFPLLASKEINSGASPRVGAARMSSLWPTPSSTQMFVAVARCGKRHVHNVTRGAVSIRAVVSDLDGTLLGPDKRVSARTLEAVRKIRRNGILFIPASGRSSSGMFSAMGELGQDLLRDGSPFISMNGLTVHGQGEGGGYGKIIFHTIMCPRLAMRVVDFWKKHRFAGAAGVSLCGSCGDTVVVERLDERTQRYVDWKEPKPEEVGSFKDAITGGLQLNRLYFWGPSRSAVDAFKGDLEEHLKDYPKELTRGMGEMIEVLPPGSSKAVGLEALLKEVGIPAEEVMALGDEDNDIEMLRAVGHGVAMGQASISVRKAARYTAPSNALDGVAVALETFCGV